MLSHSNSSINCGTSHGWGLAIYHSITNKECIHMGCLAKHFLSLCVDTHSIYSDCVTFVTPLNVVNVNVDFLNERSLLANPGTKQCKVLPKYEEIFWFKLNNCIFTYSIHDKLVLLYLRP